MRFYCKNKFRFSRVINFELESGAREANLAICLINKEFVRNFGLDFLEEMIPELHNIFQNIRK